MFAYPSPMGGPRASTMRMIYAGRICASCSITLPERTDGRTGERRCQTCFEKTLRTVHMNFMRRDGWHISFLEEDGRTSLPWTGTVATEQAIYGVVARTYQPADAERALENCIRHWARGTVKLRVTPEQYLTLKSRVKR